ncbi:monooxygenase [Blastopirellula marina]|uniref:Monooxygenase n=1 Tax=Blastopirellula marina TaxID=124 RepID=A0A2S8GTQ1_9BACT|nr:monooxygenase [Blastopirellula marina]
MGAGPIGIEAALYARFLGYEVTVLEAGQVGEHLLAWGHVPMFTPFGEVCTPLGLSALAAQDESYDPPAEDAILTGQQYLDAYLRPLSETDLVAGCLKLQHQVISIARRGQLKQDTDDPEERREAPLVTLVRDGDGHEHSLESEIVLDCSGVQGQPNFLGDGGQAVPGESAAMPHFGHGVIDALGRDRDRYANQQILVIGAGHSAATNICQLSRLARESLDTHVTWITREGSGSGESGPLTVREEDPHPEKRRVAQAANHLTTDADGHIAHWPATTVKSVHYEPQNDHFHVTLEGEHSGVFTFDRVVANVGYRPDLQMLRELQIETCADWESTTKLVQPEPNVYILGAKSYGRRSDFLLATGFDQIRQLFAIVGDRESLNLYAKPLPKST